METVVLTVHEPNDAGVYPITLQHVDPATYTLEERTAEASMAGSFSLAAAEPDRAPAELRARFLAAQGYSKAVPQIGACLFRALMQGDVRTRWEALRSGRTAGQPPPPPGAPPPQLRTILDIRPAELRQLPWELLYEEQGRRCLFLQPDQPWCRGHCDFPAPEPVTDGTLRVLIVVGARAEDEALKADEEISAIWDACRRYRWWIELELLERPRYAELQKMLTEFRPHVLHFIGHGRAPRGGEDAALLVTREQHESWEWQSSAIAQDVQGLPDLRLVFINACRSGDAAEQESVWTITDAFRSVPAVLGMQADIPGAIAVTYARAIYEALTEGEPVDVAVARGRNAVRQEDPEWLQKRDWALGVLVVTAPPTRILPPPSQFNVTLRATVETVPEFLCLKAFVDRRDLRWSLGSALRPPVGAAPSSRLLIVTGGGEVGKSTLVYGCLEACMLHGQQLRYVDLKSVRTTDFLAPLRLIRDGYRAIKDADERQKWRSPIREPLPPAKFDLFNWQLNHRLRDSVPPPLDIAALVGRVPDEGLNWRAHGEDEDEEIILAIFSDFRAALTAVAADQPLLIALDHLNIDPTFFKTYFFPELIGRILEGELPNVRMILTLSHEECSDSRFDLVSQLRGRPRPEGITVDPFPAEDYVRLATEYCRHHALNTRAARELIVKEAQNKGAWRPGDLVVYTMLSFLRRN